MLVEWVEPELPLTCQCVAHAFVLGQLLEFLQGPGFGVSPSVMVQSLQDSSGFIGHTTFVFFDGSEQIDADIWV